jgi:lipoprotein-releasing system permease protein
VAPSAPARRRLERQSKNPVRKGDVHYAWKVGLRYLRPKDRHFLISVLTLISTIGVMFAVAAPEISLSVMNGFETEVRQRIINTNYHVFVMSREPFRDYESTVRALEQRDDVRSVSPFVRREAVLSFSGGGSLTQRFHGCIVLGVDADRERRTTRVIDAVRPEFLGFESDLFDEVDGRHYPDIVLGVELSRELAVSLGDVITVAAARDTENEVQRFEDLEFTPRQFRVIGFLNSGFYEFDARLAFIDLAQAQDFFGFEKRVYGIGVRVNDVYDADHIAADIDQQLGIEFYTNNWIFMFRNIFTWLKTERFLLALVFLLIASVAVVTVVGMLTMIVFEKRKAIGILKGMGATRAGIMGIFMIQGTAIGVAGAALGSLLGWGGCEIVDRVGIDLPGDVYIIDSLPVAMHGVDFLLVSAAVVTLCFLATLYPSWEAARLDPIDAIRYE